jgi:hypothetical protein
MSAVVAQEVSLQQQGLALPDEVTVAVYLASDNRFLLEVVCTPAQLVAEIAQELVEASIFPLRPRLLLEGVPLSSHLTVLDTGISDGDQLLADMSYPLALTTSADGSVRLWNGETGECESTLEGHAEPVLSAAITPSYRWVVTASEDTTAKVWGVKSGSCISTLAGHEEAVYSAAFSPTSILIVTASADCSARIWSFEGECKRILLGHTGPVFSATFSEDCETVVTQSNDSRQKIWSVKSGACRKTLLHDSHDDSLSTRYVTSYSADGKYWIAPESDEAHVCLTKTGECLQRLVGHENLVVSACFAASWVAPEGPKPRAVPNFLEVAAVVPVQTISPRASPRRQHRERDRHKHRHRQSMGRREPRQQSTLDILQRHLEAARRGDGHPYFGRRLLQSSSLSPTAHTQSVPSLPSLPSLGKAPMTRSSSEAVHVNRSLGQSFRQARGLDQTYRVFN